MSDPVTIRIKLEELRLQLNAFLDAKIQEKQRELDWIKRFPVAGSVGVQQALVEQRTRLVLNAIDDLRYEES